jgi:hypothetical protein
MQMAREDAPDMALFMPRLLPSMADPSRNLIRTDRHGASKCTNFSRPLMLF